MARRVHVLKFYLIYSPQSHGNILHDPHTNKPSLSKSHIISWFSLSYQRICKARQHQKKTSITTNQFCYCCIAGSSILRYSDEGSANACLVSESEGDSEVWEKTVAALASWKKLTSSSGLDYCLKLCLQYCTTYEIAAKFKTKIFLKREKLSVQYSCYKLFLSYTSIKAESSLGGKAWWQYIPHPQEGLKLPLVLMVPQRALLVGNAVIVSKQVSINKCTTHPEYSQQDGYV